MDTIILVMAMVAVGILGFIGGYLVRSLKPTPQAEVTLPPTKTEAIYTQAEYDYEAERAADIGHGRGFTHGFLFGSNGQKPPEKPKGGWHKGIMI